MSVSRLHIPDGDIVMTWRCEEEDCNEECEVDPSFYESCGTPICECGTDMSYVRTEIIVQC